MYKKIRNSSFMNLIWAILCLLPLIFIIVDLTNENNKQKTIYNYNTFASDYHNDYVFSNEISTNNGDYMVYNYECNSIVFDIDREAEKLSFEEYFHVAKTGKFYIYYVIYNCYEDYFEYYSIETAPFYCDVKITGDGDYQTNWHLSGDYIYVLEFSLEFDNIQDASMFNVEFFEFGDLDSIDYLTINFFITDTKIEDLDLLKDNNNVVEVVPNFYWYNHFTSKGFIYNAFMILGGFFGVSNIYYQLACCYIEYLLIIVLLHLAFDVLYILPNICHKFMEKIGGERD